MNIIADTHVHTIMSGHAHSTLLENFNVAKEKGHKFLFITDHSGELGMSPDKVGYFWCLNATLPESYDGLRIVKGCEASIINKQAEIDFPEELAKGSEWLIASLHEYLIEPFSFDETTDVWLKIAENQYVDVIGHCGEKRWQFDFEKCIKKFKEYNKIVEFNASSIGRGKIAKADAEELARLCKKYEVMTVVSSDAHFAPTVGEVSKSIALLESVGFPEKLVLNADAERLGEYLNNKKR